jgi:CheY-like chemotaxis protein
VAHATRDLADTLHEVSNALTVILGWIERARDANDGDLARALEIAAVRARDARRIVRRAIAVERDVELAGPSSEVFGAAPHDERRPLGEVIDDATAALEPEARRAGIHLRVAVGAGVATRPVDAGAAVVQILTNLLLNAIAMSPRGSVVQVDAAEGGGGIVVGVSDEGPGIPPERRATLFSAGISTRAGGAGIGLRYSASLASAAGGALSLAPSKRGARFELRWPLPGAPGGQEQGEAADSAPHKPPSGAILQGIRILLVEDDEAVVDLLDTALTARGATIVSVRDVADLPGALASGPFHAALLDISPIEKDVSGTVAAVRTASPDARLVVMSGSVNHVPELQNASFSSWVRKPFEVREIVEALVD